MLTKKQSINYRRQYRLDGAEHEVTWGALIKEDFMKACGTVKVKGTVAGSDKTMEAAVEFNSVFQNVLRRTGTGITPHGVDSGPGFFV